MILFKKMIKFLIKLKYIGAESRREGLSDREKEDLDRIPVQNPYGLIGLVFGGIAFAFGPQHGLIAVVSLLFCLVTLCTFEKEKEDNIWSFYMGIVLSVIGLGMYIVGETHQLVL